MFKKILCLLSLLLMHNNQASSQAQKRADMQSQLKHLIQNQTCLLALKTKFGDSYDYYGHCVAYRLYELKLQIAKLEARLACNKREADRRCDVFLKARATRGKI